MRKISKVFMLLLLTTLMGCRMTNDGDSEKQIKQSSIQLSEDDYKKKINGLTDKEISKIIVDDFDDDETKEAFVLTKKNQDDETNENTFELWFLTPNKSEKIVDSFVGANNTNIELLGDYDNYILLNKSQTRQNDYMEATIYGVENDNVKEMFSQKRMNMFVENNELYAYNYSYFVLGTEVKEWMSLSEQKYHFRWDDESKQVKEYEAETISEEEFMMMSHSQELMDNIYSGLKKLYEDEIIDIEYGYLLREDKTVDVNMLVTTTDGTKYKNYVSVSYTKKSLGTEIEIFEGNKEEALIKYLSK